MSTRRGGAPPAAAGKGRTPLHGLGGRNPLVLLAGGGAAVVLVVAMVRRGSGSSSGSTTQTPNTYDSTLSDIEAQWENQFEQLQGEIANLNPHPTTGSTSTAGHPVVYPGGSPGGPPRNVNVAPVRLSLAMPAPTAPAIHSTIARNTLPAAAATPAGLQRTYTASLSPAAKR